MHFALEMMCNALDLEGQAWDDLVYSPTMWQDEEGKRRMKASPMQKEGPNLLRNLKRNPSEAAAHMRTQLAFRAKDVGVETVVEQARKKQREEVRPEPRANMKADAVMKEIMLTKEPRPAIAAKDMEDHQKELHARGDYKEAKRNRKKNARKKQLDELKALKEKGKRDDEMDFYAARKE